MSMSRADVAREKTEGVRFDRRKSDPTHLHPDTKDTLRWKQVYEALWKIKNASRKGERAIGQ